MKRVSTLLVAMLAACMMTGVASAQDTLKKIRDTGTITIGHRDTSIPFSYYDDKQQVVGYAMDICMKIVDAVKAQLKMPKLEVKLNPVKSILAGQRVVLIDDSIVRGTTSRKIVKMVRAAGAREVHLRISCPPTVSPCFYGVDTPRRSELIAATHSLDEIRRYVGADSLGYLSLEGLLEAVGARRQHYCTSCYTGQYPVAFPRDENAYLQLTLKLNGAQIPLPEEEPEGVV